MNNYTFKSTCYYNDELGSEKWTGKRVWNKDKNNLRPKLVFCKKVKII